MRIRKAPKVEELLKLIQLETLDSTMTADALLESGLQAGAPAVVQFTGGTLLAPGHAGPVRLVSAR